MIYSRPEMWVFFLMNMSNLQNDVNGVEDQLSKCAMKYAEMGYFILPCKPPVGTNKKYQKMPESSLVPSGVKDASNDVETVVGWWEGKRLCNVGIAGGKGLIIIDLDVKDGKNGVEDLHHIAEDAGASFPEDCPMAKTPSGGVHLYFRCENSGQYTNGVGIQYKGKKTAIDVRADNSYVLAAPSAISAPEKDETFLYEWERPLVPMNELPLLPEWLADVLPKKNAPDSGQPQSNFQDKLNRPIQNTGISQTDINDRIQKYIETTDEAISGQSGHNTTIRVLGTIYHGFDLTKNELQQWAEYYNETKCDPQWSVTELNHKIEDVSTKWQSQNGKPRGYLLTHTNYPSEMLLHSTPPIDPKTLKALQVAESDAEQITPPLIGDANVDIPPEIFQVPGFVSQYMNAYRQYATKYNPLFGLAGALTLLSFSTNRRIRWGKTRSSFYAMVVAPSGCGKQAAQDINTEIMRQSGLVNHCFANLTSDGALEGVLAKNKKAYINWDEADVILNTFNKGETWEKKLANALKTVYTSGDSSYTCRARADYIEKRKVDTICQPGLSILLSSTPDKTFKSIHLDMVTDGLMPRITLFDVKDSTLTENNNSLQDITLTKLVNFVRFWKNPHFELGFYQEVMDTCIPEGSRRSDKPICQIWEDLDKPFYLKNDDTDDQSLEKHNPDEILSNDTEDPKFAIAAQMTNHDRIEQCNLDIRGVQPDRPFHEPYNEQMDHRFEEPAYVEPFNIVADDDAEQRFHEFKKWADHDHSCTDCGWQDAIWSRAAEKVGSLALIYAASENQYHPKITLNGVEWAITFVKWCIESMINRLKNATYENAEDANRKRILRIINKNTEKTPQSEGWVSRSVITVNVNLEKKVLGDVLDNLVESKILEMIKQKIKTSRKATQFYRVRKNGDNNW